MLFAGLNGMFFNRIVGVGPPLKAIVSSQRELFGILSERIILLSDPTKVLPIIEYFALTKESSNELHNDFTIELSQLMLFTLRALPPPPKTPTVEFFKFTQEFVNTHIFRSTVELFILSNEEDETKISSSDPILLKKLHLSMSPEQFSRAIVLQYP